MKAKEEEFRKVVAITAIIATECNGIAYLWVDGKRYYSMRIDPDLAELIYEYQDSSVEFDPAEMFDEVINICDIIYELGYRLHAMKIYSLRGDLCIIGECRHRRTKESRWINLTRSQVIDIYYYRKKRVPILIDEQLLINENSSLLRQLPDFSVEALEELLEIKRAERDVHGLRKQFPVSGSETRKKKKKDSLLSRYKRGEDLNVQELKKLLEDLAARDQTTDFLLAAEVRDRIQNLQKQQKGKDEDPGKRAGGLPPALSFYFLFIQGKIKPIVSFFLYSPL